MFDNIFETVVKGSNTVFLDIPEDDYFFRYESLSEDSAQELVSDYFITRARDGIPHVKDVTFDGLTHRVRVTVAVDHKRENKLDQYQIPDFLNATRK